MSDQRGTPEGHGPDDLAPEDLPVGAVDAAGQAIDPATVDGQDQGDDVADVSVDDLSVQGGE